MKEILRTNDLVFFSFLEFRLREEGIEPFIMDVNASILARPHGILPRRLMVVDDDFDAASAILDAARATKAQELDGGDED